MLSIRSATAVAAMAVVATAVGLAVADGRYVLDVVNRIMPRGPAVIYSPAHSGWRNITRQKVALFLHELTTWEAAGNQFPEFTSLTPAHYFPEVDLESHGKPQKRTWGFLWLRLYGQQTQLAQSFPHLIKLYDSLPVEVYSLGISKLDPGRGDVTHFGEFRGTWRQLLTLEAPALPEAIHLGLYPYGPGSCDSIWTRPEEFQEKCRSIMSKPLIHRYETGKDILFDDTVWHFIHNNASSRRVALWVDVVRTDLNLIQRSVLRIFMILATYLNDEVTDTVRLVNSVQYQHEQHLAPKATSTQIRDDSPAGPTESYDPTNLIDVDVGFS